MDRIHHYDREKTPGPYNRKNSAPCVSSHSNRALLERRQAFHQEERYFNSMTYPPTFPSGVHNYHGENVQHHIPDTQLKLIPQNPLNNLGVPDFVKKLFRLLETKSHDNIVSWGIHRVTFAVKDTEEFARHILAKHFKHNNFASFVRQLNKYDFHKVKMSAEDAKIYGERAWEFQHPDFQADRPELLEKIKRKAPTGRHKPVSAVITARSRSFSPPSTEPSHEDLHQLKEGLQNQIDTLAGIQGNMASYLQSLSKDCTAVVEELTKIRKNMVAQDTVMQNLVEYMMHQGSACAEQKVAQNMNERQTNRRMFPPTTYAPVQTPPVTIEDVDMPLGQQPQTERSIDTYAAVTANETFDRTDNIPCRAFVSPGQMTYSHQSSYGSNFPGTFLQQQNTSYRANPAFLELPSEEMKGISHRPHYTASHVF